MTTKQDKKPVHFVTANHLRQFIQDQKTEITYKIKDGNRYYSLGVTAHCFVDYLEKNRKKENSICRYHQFAKRLEREFLRKEEELNRFIEVQVEDNGSYITVFDGKFSHNEIFNLNAIFKDITLKVIRDMYFKNGNGCYRFKFLSPYIGFVDISDHTHFELIDFKPLEK